MGGECEEVESNLDILSPRAKPPLFRRRSSAMSFMPPAKAGIRAGSIAVISCKLIQEERVL